MLHTNGTFPLPPARVLEAVAVAYGLTVAEITAPGRAGRPVEMARRTAVQLLREECWLSWPNVSQAMGRAKNGGWACRITPAAPAAIEALRRQLRDPDQPSLF